MNLEFDIKSFNFITWHWKNDFNLEDAKREIDYQILNCNINAVTFAFAAQQDHCYSTTIDWTGSHMPNDNQLEDLIKYSKDKGLKTLVKPMLNVSDGYWRAYIRFFDEDVPCEPKWEEWFKSYGEYIIHYAQFCQKNNVDILIIGCELVGTDHRCDEWKSLVKNIRRIYNGALTYNCDKYQEHNVKWWDALDYISSSGYYPVGTISKELDRIEEVCKKFNLPFIFTEAGCPSVKGASKMPNDWFLIETGEVCEENQYNYFKELFEESSKRGFIKGFSLWDWPIKSPQNAKDKYEKDYTVKFKKAENLIFQYFSE